MPTYVVTRHGSNAANQPLCQRAVLGAYDAPGREQAKAAAEREHTVYHNQHLGAIPWSRASRADRDAALEAGAFAEEERRYFGELEREAVG